MNTPHITFNPADEAYLTFLGTEFDKGIHVIVPCRWIEQAKRWAKRDTLFVYFHRYERTYVLADWIYKPNTGKGPGLMTELEVTGRHPDMGGAEGWTRDFVAMRCNPNRGLGKIMRSRIAALRKERQMLRDATEQERKATAKMLRKKMGNHSLTPSLLASGALPFVGKTEGGDRLKEVARMLRGQM